VQRDCYRNERAQPAVRIAFALAVSGMIREAATPEGSASVPILFLTAAALAYWAGRNSFRSRIERITVNT
jgi:hypothetical protein